LVGRCGRNTHSFYSFVTSYRTYWIRFLLLSVDTKTPTNHMDLWEFSFWQGVVNEVRTFFCANNIVSLLEIYNSLQI
jgi:hypothetical protein